MRPFTLAVFLIYLHSIGIAQSYTTVKTTSAKALSSYNAGNDEAARGQAAIAQGYFEMALKADPKFIDAKLSLADNYAELRDFFKAEKHFEEAIAMDSTYKPVAGYFLAKIEWELDKYVECAEHAASYLRSQPKNVKNKLGAQRLLSSAQFASNAVGHPVPFDPKPVSDSINTRWSEYFPSLTADNDLLVFTRRDGDYDENFYQGERLNGVWQKARPLQGVNTEKNEGASSVSPDGSWMAFTACNREGDGSQGSCDLYWSQLKSTGWTKPVPFSSTINSESWESQPTIGADNRTLIFIRDTISGIGNHSDIYQSVRLPTGKWSVPEILGPQINTPGKEDCPFLHPDGQTLYFTSDSLPGMGNADIFFSRKQADGTWGKAQNLGYPINTKGREAGLVVSLDGRTAYVSSDRPDGRGGLDLYTFELPEFARPQKVTYAKAKVTNMATGYPIVAKVEFTDVNTGKVFVSASTKSDGTFLVCLPAGKEYALNVNKDKFLFFSDNFNLVDSATFEKPFLLDIELMPIAADVLVKDGKPIVLRNVFFETGSAALRQQSMTELDRLVSLLTENPGLKIQINGHTDDVGDDTFNQKLSETRAKSVHDYLLSKGISPERLRFKGFGESKPLKSNDTPEGKARNRRTEFVVW
jgi:outer membrane protein OmpA-like peptidoglycan-associated protein